MIRSIKIADVALELEERGDGPPLLFLHPGEGLQPQRALARPAGAALSRDRAAPSGLGQLRAARLAEDASMTSPISISISPRRWSWRTRFWSAPASAAGSPPRWRCATRGASRSLVLADPLGIKVGGVTDRDIADMHAMPRDEYLRLAWADPANGERRL